MNIILERTAYTDMGVFGRMAWDSGSCLTVEEVWRHNARGNSCIPIGTYRVQRGRFPKHGEAFEVQGVPGRTAILIHAGNTIDDIEGCIATGDRLGCLNGKWAVMDSRQAYARFMAAMAAHDVLTLDIRNNLDQGKL